MPAGVDYDIHAYNSCGNEITLSTRRGPGEDETVVLENAESSGVDDGFTYFIEVRYVSGASCAEWTLRYDGKECGSTFTETL